MLMIPIRANIERFRERNRSALCADYELIIGNIPPTEPTAWKKGNIKIDPCALRRSLAVPVSIPSFEFPSFSLIEICWAEYLVWILITSAENRINRMRKSMYTSNCSYRFLCSDFTAINQTILPRRKKLLQPKFLNRFLANFSCLTMFPPWRLEHITVSTYDFQL